MKSEFYIILTLIFIACSTDNKPVAVSEPSDSTSPRIESLNNSEKTVEKDIPNTTKESYSKTDPRFIVVTNFLRWYRDHYETLGNIQMINNYPLPEDSLGYYSVNFKGTEEYLINVFNSGYVSKTYINTWKHYFNKCQSDFEKNPENYGIPSGFDFDFVMWSQEFETDLKNIDNIQIISIRDSDSTANIKLKFPSSSKYQYSLSSDGKNWLIDNIKNLPRVI